MNGRVSLAVSRGLVRKIETPEARSGSEKFNADALSALAKVPEMLGQLKFYIDRFRRVQSRLIEYK